MKIYDEFHRVEMLEFYLRSVRLSKVMFILPCCFVRSYIHYWRLTPIISAIR